MKLGEKGTSKSLTTFKAISNLLNYARLCYISQIIPLFYDLFAEFKKESGECEKL